MRNTVIKLSAARGGQIANITAVVPTTVISPEVSDGSDCATVWESVSASLVILLITSPWEWVSRYGTGSSMMRPKRSPRSRRTMRWLSLALRMPEPICPATPSR